MCVSYGHSPSVSRVTTEVPGERCRHRRGRGRGRKGTSPLVLYAILSHYISHRAHIASLQPGSMKRRTPLETVHRSGDLNSTREKVGEGRPGNGEEDPNHRRRYEEQSLWVVIVDPSERLHLPWLIIVVTWLMSSFLLLSSGQLEDLDEVSSRNARYTVANARLPNQPFLSISLWPGSKNYSAFCIASKTRCRSPSLACISLTPHSRWAGSRRRVR